MDSQRRRTTRRLHHSQHNWRDEAARCAELRCSGELVESDDFGAFLHSYEEVMRASIRRRGASDRDFDPARWKSAAKLLK